MVDEVVDEAVDEDVDVVVVVAAVRLFVVAGGMTAAVVTGGIMAQHVTGLTDRERHREFGWDHVHHQRCQRLRIGRTSQVRVRVGSRSPPTDVEHRSRDHVVGSKD